MTYTNSNGLTLYLCWLDDPIPGEPDVALVVAKDDDEALDIASKGPGVSERGAAAWRETSGCKPYADRGARIVTQYESRYLPENMARQDVDP